MPVLQSLNKPALIGNNLHISYAIGSKVCSSSGNELSYRASFAPDPRKKNQKHNHPELHPSKELLIVPRDSISRSKKSRKRKNQPTNQNH
jgi:hypothetical protein